MPFLIDRLRRGLAEAGKPRLSGDHGFAQGVVASERAVPAAVLVPVIQRPAPTLLLTQRTAHLRSHPGQVAFPGGRVDRDDLDVVAAALREAEEEVGLARGLVDVIGLSDPYLTGTGYAVTPVVGLVPSDVRLLPNREEVADLFEVPLDFALDPANHVLREAEWQGRQRQFYVITWQDRTIWGATAGMLVNLAARL
ncbi:CoA pyrophosphatase [Thermaurantiacus sp.]